MLNTTSFSSASSLSIKKAARFSKASLRVKSIASPSNKTPLYSSNDNINSNTIKQRDHLPKATSTFFGITEIVMPAISGSNPIVLSSLAHMSHSEPDRWFTWIDHTNTTTNSMLRQTGFNLQTTRLLQARNPEDCVRLFEKALQSGNNATVVCCCTIPSSATLKRLEGAAKKGHAQGIILRQRH